ncbi:MAG: hypothetical protein IJK33_06580 [Clostridia bacterium]|nr:hypothetical protein [Clostridia bacterium]
MKKILIVLFITAAVLLPIIMLLPSAKENEFYGIKTIEATAQQAGSYAIRIDCTSYRQFEISYADKNEEAYNGERQLPINSDLGEYVIKVHLMDTPNVSESFGKGHKIWTTYELTETGDQLRYMYCYTPDHGVLVYIGSDVPMHYTIPEQKEKGSIEFSVNY